MSCCEMMEAMNNYIEQGDEYIMVVTSDGERGETEHRKTYRTTFSYGVNAYCTLFYYCPFCGKEA